MTTVKLNKVNDLEIEQEYIAKAVAEFLEAEAPLMEPIRRGRIQLTITTNRAQDGFHIFAEKNAPRRQ